MLLTFLGGSARPAGGLDWAGGRVEDMLPRQEQQKSYRTVQYNTATLYFVPCKAYRAGLLCYAVLVEYAFVQERSVDRCIEQRIIE